MLNKLLPKIEGGNLSIFLYEDGNKKIKEGKFLKYLLKDNIIRFDFENTSNGKHDNSFVLPIPYKAELRKDEILFSYKNSVLSNIIDFDDLLDLEEQNNNKSPLYDKEIILKWNC